MRKPNIVSIAAFAAGVGLAAPSQANDIWQFTVTSDQSGPGSTCIELGYTPCSITSHASPYILADLTISAPLANFYSYVKVVDGPMTVDFDDKHVVSFVASSSLGLSGLNFPELPTYPLEAVFSVNETGTSLSGFISVGLNEPDSPVLIMTGTDSLWTGHWSTALGGIHQFWARADKVAAPALH